MFASIVNLLAGLGGLLAASIVIGGFLAHAHPAIKGEPEVKLRRATAAGGLAGMVSAILGLLALGLIA